LIRSKGKRTRSNLKTATLSSSIQNMNKGKDVGISEELLSNWDETQPDMSGNIA